MKKMALVLLWIVSLTTASAQVKDGWWRWPLVVACFLVCDAIWEAWPSAESEHKASA